MKVILRKSMPDLGEAGQVIQVKDGFARNYLIPQGIAQPATGQNLGHLANLKSFRQKKQDQMVTQAKLQGEKLEGMTVTVAKPSGEGDRLFGTVTSRDVVEALAKAGVEVDKRTIHIADPIKSLGSYTVTVKLHAEVQVPLKLEVVKE